MGLGRTPATQMGERGPLPPTCMRSSLSKSAAFVRGVVLNALVVGELGGEWQMPSAFRFSVHFPNCVWVPQGKSAIWRTLLLHFDSRRHDV